MQSYCSFDTECFRNRFHHFFVWENEMVNKSETLWLTLKPMLKIVLEDEIFMSIKSTLG